MDGGHPYVPLCAVENCHEQCYGFEKMQSLLGVTIHVPLCEQHWKEIKEQ